MSTTNGLEQTIKQQNILTSKQVESLEVLTMNTTELLEFLNEEQMTNPMIEVEESNVQEAFIQWDTTTQNDYVGSARESMLSNHETYANTPEEKGMDLAEHIVSQLPIHEYSKAQQLLLMQVINYIDTDSGFFIEAEDVMMEEIGCTKQDISEAIRIIRSLEPAGIGAMNIRDCLLLQLERIGKLDETLRILIDSYLEKIAARKVSSISRELKISTAHVRQYIQLIQSLNPKPAQAFGIEKTVYIVPDMTAEYKGEEWNVTIVAPSHRILHLNKTYMRMANEAKEPELVAYFAEKIKRAKQVVAAVEQREDTMKSMIYLLLEEQREYALRKGEKKYLTQKFVADTLGVHPSTIHRAMKNKYIRVPAGVLSIKDFFCNRKEKIEKADHQKTPITNEFNTNREEQKKIGLESEESMELKENTERKQQVSEICLIAPTEALVKQNICVCNTFGKKVDAFRASLPKACEVVEQLIQRGAKVFISRKGTKQSIEQKQVPIIEIGLSLSDYIPLMEQAKRVNGVVAFFSYGIISEDVRSMCYLLGINAKFYSFYKSEQCIKIVEEARKDGAVLGIGGADTAVAASQVGLEHLIVENSEQSLLQAIESAEQLLEVQREEAQKQERLKIQLERYEMVFNYTHDAIVAIDENGVVDVVNRGAEKIIKSANRPYLGRRIDDIIPDTRMEEVMIKGEKQLNQLMNINGTLVSTNRIPIIVDGKVKGAVATFQDVKTIQSNEQKIRVKLHEKGMVAKYHFSDIIGTSDEMKDLIRLAEKFSKSDATIMIHGETGTGKELFAQSIHNSSKRKTGPFVAVNCGSLPKNILEAELFGYVDGAFTGASKGGKQGFFEMAHGGTIFLDEIGEMPLETQVQLLRVLQEKEIRRLGSDRVTPIDIRVITATNRNLPKEIVEKRFREDLFYRLNVLNIELPPIRMRMEDVLPIGVSIFKQLAKGEAGAEVLVEKILKNLQGYSWPGNVREIYNLMERVYVLHSQGETIDFIEKYIQRYLRFSETPRESHTKEETKRDSNAREPMKEQPVTRDKAEWEKERILVTLEEQSFQLEKTAKALGMSRSTLWRRLKKYEIEI